MGIKEKFRDIFSKKRPYTTNRDYVFLGQQHYKVKMIDGKSIDLGLIEDAARDIGYVPMRDSRWSEEAVSLFAHDPLTIKVVDKSATGESYNLLTDKGYAGTVVKGDDYVSTCCVHKESIEKILKRYNELKSTPLVIQ